jgi:quercetin dioxygenase-like cupin family protein
MPIGSKAPELQILARGEGTPVWFLGCLTFLKGSAETTRGAYGLVEQIAPAGFTTPYHMHQVEDETFYVLEGTLRLFSQGRQLELSAGGYAFLPRQIPHGFRVEGNSPARVLFLSMPGGGFEQFVLEMGEPAIDLHTPPAGPPNIEKLTALATKYKIDIFGPLPE